MYVIDKKSTIRCDATRYEMSKYMYFKFVLKYKYRYQALQPCFGYT